MLIVHQKFISHMLGHYIRSCHIIMHNMHEMWGLIYLCAMRTVPMTCYRTCSDIMRILHGMHMQACWPPYIYVAHQELLMDGPFMQAE